MRKEIKKIVASDLIVPALAKKGAKTMAFFSKRAGNGSCPHMHHNKKAHSEECAEKVFPSVSLPHYADNFSTQGEKR